MSDEYDPWHETKKWLEQCKATADMATKRQIALVDHLHDKIDRLTKRVAELEKASEIVRRLAEFAANEKADVIDLLKVSDDAAELWAEMQQEAKQ